MMDAASLVSSQYFQLMEVLHAASRDAVAEITGIDLAVGPDVGRYFRVRIEGGSIAKIETVSEREAMKERIPRRAPFPNPEAMAYRPKW